MRNFFIPVLLVSLLTVKVNARSSQNNLMQVKIANGILEGINESGIHPFKGIPYAKPPIGELRWKEPQPVTSWEGVRKADAFGPRPCRGISTAI